MTEEVIATAPSIGEVLVRDTETGDMYWVAGTEEQIESVTADILAAGEYGTVTYQEYVAPEPGYIAPPPPAPVIAEPFVAYEPPVEAIVEAPEQVSALSVSTDFMGWLIDRFNWLGEYFYSIYLEVNSWISPLNYAAYLFSNYGRHRRIDVSNLIDLTRVSRVQ